MTSAGEHISVPSGTIIANRWKVVTVIGAGNFARVYKCVDVTKKSALPIALKIIKKEYTHDAQIEKVILDAIGDANANVKRATGRSHRVVRCLEYFLHEDCPCMVFELAGPTLRRCRMDQVPNRMDQFRTFVKEMLITLQFLHEDCHVIHTDLKPENILVDKPDHDTNVGIGNSWSIADLGSASFYNPQNPDKDLISTRPYRAPEVILGLPWTTKADIFSMGAIFYEVYVGGKPLFDIPDDDGVHLAAVETRLGPLSPRLIKAISRNTRQYNLFNHKTLKLAMRPGAHQPGPVRHLNQIITSEPLLLSFLTDLLQSDPDRRVSARQALNHPFITNGNKNKLMTGTSHSAEVSRSGYMPSSVNNNNQFQQNHQNQQNHQHQQQQQQQQDNNDTALALVNDILLGSKSSGGNNNNNNNNVKIITVPGRTHLTPQPSSASNSAMNTINNNNNNAEGIKQDQLARLKQYVKYYNIDRTEAQLHKVVERYNGVYDAMWLQLEQKYGLEADARRAMQRQGHQHNNNNNNNQLYGGGSGSPGAAAAYQHQQKTSHQHHHHNPFVQHQPPQQTAIRTVAL